MRIIIKYLLKSITEKKFRTFLVIFAIALSGSLFFASTSLSDSLVALFTKQIYQMIGNAEIMIYANENSPSGFISMAPASKIQNQAEYIIPTLSDSAHYKTGTYTSDTISLTGISLEDYTTFNELSLVRKIKDASFEGYSLIISKQTAEKYGVDVGDTMELTVSGGKRSFTVYGISNPVGMFGSESNSTMALVPFHTLSVFQGSGDRPNILYIRSNSDVDYTTLMTQLSTLYPKYTVEEPFNYAELSQSINQIAMPLLFMTVLVTFMSIFIVNSSFKVITLEKLPHVGTFRSIGASKKMMNRVLFLESLCYGIIGGIVSCLLGIGILKLLVKFIGSQDLGGRATMTVVLDPTKMLITFVLSLIICLVSSMLPILRVGKIPVKEIVLGNVTKVKKHKSIKYILGFSFLAVAILLPKLLPSSLYLLTGNLGIILGITGVIQILPLLVKLTSHIAEFIFSKVFGNIGLLAVKNIRGNKSMLNSITLLTLGIGILLMINTLSTNINVEVINFYDKTFNFDIMAYVGNLDKYVARHIETEPGVEKVVPVYEKSNVHIKELNTKVSSLLSVQGEEFDDFMHLFLQNDSPKLLNKLNDGRYIILTVILKNRYDLKVGDLVTLEFEKGNRTYEVVGFSDTLWNNGSLGVIGETYMQLDSKSPYYSMAYIRTSEDPDTVIANLTTEFADSYFYGYSLTYMKTQNAQSNAQFMLILVAFSMLAVVIGVVGIINNLLISFIERKQSIAVLRSVGLSKKQTITMIFLEAVYSSILGGLIGIFTGWVALVNMPLVLEGMELSMPIYMIPETLWVYVVAGMVITVIASITPALRSSKLNIIEAIKFE